MSRDETNGGILDFFVDVDGETFEYVDFNGVTDSELSLTAELLGERLKLVPEVVSALDCFGGNGGDSDDAYEDEDGGHAANSSGHHQSKGKARYLLYTYVQ